VGTCSAGCQVGDTLEDAAAVLGFSRCMTLLVEPLAALSMQQQAGMDAASSSETGGASAAGGAAGGRGYDWRTAEAALFCIKYDTKARDTRAGAGCGAGARARSASFAVGAFG
jgi:hypothetical protein